MHPDNVTDWLTKFSKLQFGYIPLKGGDSVRITITFYVRNRTVSIIAKSGNRHSAK